MTPAARAGEAAPKASASSAITSASETLRLRTPGVQACRVRWCMNVALLENKRPCYTIGSTGSDIGHMEYNNGVLPRRGDSDVRRLAVYQCYDPVMRSIGERNDRGSRRRRGHASAL